MVAAGAVIEHPTQNKILVAKRAKTDHAKNEWELPYGRLNNHEELVEGLKREVFEETGLTDLKIKKLLRVWHFYRGEKSADKEVFGVTFLCQATSDQIKLSPEHDQYRWVEPKKALKMIKVVGIANDVKLYLDYLEKQDLKIHLSDTSESLITL